jgi:hypothetical protein
MLQEKFVGNNKFVSFEGQLFLYIKNKNKEKEEPIPLDNEPYPWV